MASKPVGEPASVLLPPLGVGQCCGLCCETPVGGNHGMEARSWRCR